MMLRKIADRKVFPIGLGVMALDEYEPKADEQEAISLLKYAAQKVDFMDTADVYGIGRNEELIGKALSEEQKSKVLIATKAGCTRPGGYGWGTDGRPEHIKKAIHESLKRLDVKHIHLYQLHAPDHTHRIPLKQSVNALKELQSVGLVKFIGLSNVSLEELREAEKIVEIVSVQNHYNIAFKRDEEELLPYLTRNNITYIPYFPLGSGRLLSDPKLKGVAQRSNITTSQICLAWMLNKWPTAIPIPGTKNKEHLDENIKAAEIELPQKVIKEINELY